MRVSKFLFGDYKMNAITFSAQMGARLSLCLSVPFRNLFHKPMMKTGISFCSVILSVATLSTPSIALASQVPGTGVINGTFSTPQSAKNSPWIQYYPSGVREADTTNPGIKMQEGRLYMEPRNGPCNIPADIAVFQDKIVPIDNDISDMYVELEFDLKINLEASYNCDKNRYKAWAAADLIALKPKVWEGTPQLNGQIFYSTLQGQGSEFMISTELAGNGWYHYKSSWERKFVSEDTRYLISFQLGDMGEYMCYEIDKNGCIYARPNQANLELDNVQLTSKNACQASCTVIPTGTSLDVLFDAVNPSPRAVLGGPFSGEGGPNACPVNSCPADLNNDGAVNGADLAVVLSAWGSDNCIADFNNDGVVNGADLSWVLSAWGACP